MTLIADECCRLVSSFYLFLLPLLLQEAGSSSLPTGNATSTSTVPKALSPLSSTSTSGGASTAHTERPHPPAQTTSVCRVVIIIPGSRFSEYISHIIIIIIISSYVQCDQLILLYFNLLARRQLRRLILPTNIKFCPISSTA